MTEHGENELMFFDTFSHETSDDLKIDLVQFPKPLYITEIRIIPLGARVQANFPGGVRLGATNPSQFKIQFFINDFNNARAATFENFGSLEYNQNGNINLECDSKVMTDGLVLRGLFTTITLAIYGRFPKTLPKEPTPIPEILDTNTTATAEWVEQHAQVLPTESVKYDPIDNQPAVESRNNLVTSFEKNTHEEWKTNTSERFDEEQSEVKSFKPNSPPNDDEHTIRVRGPRSLYGRSRESLEFSRSQEWEDEDGYNKSYSGDSWGDRKRPRSPSTPPPADEKKEGKFLKRRKRCGMELRRRSVSPTQDEVEPFEPILSDDDIGDESEAHVSKRSSTATHTVAPVSFEESNYTEDGIKLFDPFTFDIKSTPAILKDPCLTSFEWHKLHDEYMGPIPEVTIKQRNKLTSFVLDNNIDENNGGDRWVTLVEHICPLVKVFHYVYPEHQISILNNLLDWVNTVLDYDKALEQPNGLKIRHIKAGIRLTEALLNIEQELNYKLLVNFDIDKKLMHIFKQDYMAPSIKLMILNTLDNLLVNRKIVEQFIARGGYINLLDLIGSKQLIRIKYSINNLINKIHIFETLDSFNKIVKKKVIEKETTESILLLLEQIINSYKQIPTKIIQPKRFLPVSSQFDIVSSVHPDLYRCIFIFYKEFELFECFLYLLNSTTLPFYTTMVNHILDFINILIDSHDGLLFIIHYDIDIIMKMFKMLIGSHLEDPAVLHDPMEPSSVLLQGLDIQLGISLAYKMKTISIIDEINYIMLNNQADPDSNYIVDLLNELFCLTLTNEGKQAVSHILSHDKNISLLLKIYKSKAEIDLKKKSPSKLYISDLIKLTIKYSNYVPFLIKYSNDLINLNNQEYSELSGISSYLKPLYIENIFNYDDVSEHIDILEKYVDNICNLPGEVVTTLRILNYISGTCVNIEEDESNNNHPQHEEYKQLKHKYVILQLYSQDGIHIINNILCKLNEHYEQAFMHMFINSYTLMTIISLCLKLLSKMLYYVIQCRNSEYKDLTCVNTLININSLCYYIPTSSNGYSIAQNICKQVINILLTFTLPVTHDDVINEKESLNKSLWSLMMSNVIKNITNSPHLFIPGLCILSEMLPLHLPMQTTYDLTSEERTRYVNWRKLWCAHLHPLTTQLQEVIITLSGSSYQPILQLLRRVCIQLADLAPPTALLVTKSILDTIISNLPEERTPCTNHTARLLSFLAYLITHPSIKMAFIHLVTKSNIIKNEEKYFSLLLSLCDIYRTPYDNTAHSQSQDCIISIIQTLCDTSVTLHPQPPYTSLDVYIANALPYKDTLINIIEVLIDHIGNEENNFSTLLPTLRTILLICYNDIGFYHIKSCLEFKKNPLLNLCNKLYTSFNKDNPEYLNTLSSLLELIRDLLAIPPESDLTLRSLNINAQELARLLIWDVDHPLRSLLTTLQELESPDEIQITLRDNVSGLVILLDETGNKPVPDKVNSEPPLLPMESLLVQFSARHIYIKGDVDEEKLSAAYWLPSIIPDEVELDVEQIPCNISELAKIHLPEIDFAEDVKNTILKNVSPSEINIVVTPKKKAKIVPAVVIPSSSTSAGSMDSSNIALNITTYSPMNMDIKTRKPFVTPMRGRGFRTITTMQRGDIFRTRLPNTSRPPSLHVDEFVALETCGQQPTGPTGYNKISMRAQELISRPSLRGNRGRGYILQPDRGGRFFPTMPQYRPNRGIAIPPPNWVPQPHPPPPHHQVVHQDGNNMTVVGPPQQGPPPQAPPHYHEQQVHHQPHPHGPPPPQHVQPHGHNILQRPRGAIRMGGWPQGPPQMQQMRGPHLPQRHMRPQFAPR